MNATVLAAESGNVHASFPSYAPFFVVAVAVALVGVLLLFTSMEFLGIWVAAAGAAAFLGTMFFYGTSATSASAEAIREQLGVEFVGDPAAQLDGLSRSARPVALRVDGVERRCTVLVVDESSTRYDLLVTCAEDALPRLDDDRS